MKNNPVYKREMLVRSRSFRIPLIIMIFNGILAVVALLNMYQSIAQVKVSGSVRYENFLQLYAFVAALEFMLLMFIMPALTSASISGERERHTLELMFTTKIRPVEIVVGKLMSAFSQLMILVVSSLPILMLTFIYGSISSGDLMILLVSYVVGALYCGSLGIFASSLMKRSTFSNVITYGIMLVVVVGTYMLNVFLLNISETEISTMALNSGETIPKASSGASVYLLLLNPAIMFAELLENQVAGGGGNFTITHLLGDNGGNFITNHWVFCSLVTRRCSLCFLPGSGIFLKPEIEKNRFLWKAHRNRTEVIDNVLYRMPSFLGEGIPCHGKGRGKKIGAATRFSFYKKSQGRKREAVRP